MICNLLYCGAKSLPRMTGKVRPELTLPGLPMREDEARSHHAVLEMGVSGRSKLSRGKGGRGGVDEGFEPVGVDVLAEEEGSVEVARMVRTSGRRIARRMERMRDML